MGLLWCFMAATPGMAPGQGPPVTGDALEAADPEEWLSYGRDYAETHHSPLEEIDAANVDRLGLAWSVEVGSESRVEATPLIADGIIYGTTTWSKVFAINARTGEIRWEWDPGLVSGGYASGGPSICCGPVNRGVALHGDKVYAGLLDGRLIALDRETGAVAWAVQTTPVGTDYSITGAPRIVEGMVIIGNAGAEFGVRGYVTAYDAETGDEVWRFYTVPGNPADGFENEAMERAARTWTGEWWIYGGGGTVWDGMAYDPEAGLLYIGVGNGSPWNRDIRSPGGGDNLYLTSILALRPDSGELVWYYQTSPGEDWDYTAVQPILLVDLEIDGAIRQVLMQAPKNGFFYVLDRLTGELISAEPYVPVTWADGIDMETGRPVETPQARYDAEGVMLEPGPAGGHNWHPMSFNPETGLVYIPGRLTRFYYSRPPEFDPRRGQSNPGVPFGRGGPGGGEPSPAQEFVLAWDPVAQEERWRFALAPGLPTTGGGFNMNAGTLSTAGNLVFSGDGAGLFYAFHAETGEALWTHQLYPNIATPITYELDGRQYISVLSGNGAGNSAPGRLYTFALDGTEPMPVIAP
jgi:alcohol dehydrogenase (cytochrome c)/quinohemoprotein ethanol dehydrogenase